MATIKDVAKTAGVSIATVSNYLNQTRPVSKALSLKIQQAIDSLNYSQNLSAKSLRSNTYSDIGIILPGFDDSYYVQMFKGMESILQSSGYYTNLAFSYDIPQTEQTILKNFQKKNIQGLILVPSQPENWKFYYDHFASSHKPLVLIDRDVNGLDANFISSDNYYVVRQVTTSLLEQGHRKVFFFSGPRNFECEVNCANGFSDAFQALKLTVEPDAWIVTNMSKEDSFRKVLRLLQTTIPDSIVVTSESIAIGVVEGLRCLGYAQEEVPVVTLTEEHWNRHTHTFASACAALPAIKLGQKAASMLLDQLKAPMTKENEKMTISPTSAYSVNDHKRFIPPPHEHVESPPEKSIRILMLDTPQVHALLGLLGNFERQNTIKADVTILPHHQLYRTIVDTIEDDTADIFDVFMYDIPWLSSLASGDYLADITDDIDRHIDPDIFLPNCFRFFSEFNHRFYGLPFMYAPQIFYYRKDLFEDSNLMMDYYKRNNIGLRPPKTLKEFNTIADFFTNHTDAIHYGISIPAAYDECLAPEIYMRLYAFGGRIFDNQGHVRMNQNIALKAYLNFLRSARLAKPDLRSCTDVTSVQDFLIGETAMLISYPSFLADVADLRRSSQIGAIGYDHVPGRSSILGGWSLGISSRSVQKKEAFSFLKWLCDEQISTYFTLLGGQTAISSTYTNDEIIKLYPWFPLYHSTYQYSKPTLPPYLGESRIISQNDIDAIICRWIYKLLDDEIEVSEAIAATIEELKNLADASRLVRR